jgi:hypothetical protein
MGELVKCKSSKCIHKPKVPSVAGYIRIADRIPEALAGHVCPSLDMFGPHLILDLTGLIRVPSQVLVALARHVQLLDRTCPAKPKSTPAKSLADLSGLLAGFQRDFPDMSGPSPDMPDLSHLSQVKAPDPDMSDSHARF